jgi:hypothetical protein
VEILFDESRKEFSMSKFAIGEKVEKTADDHEDGIVIAVFPTVDGNFRYAVDITARLLRC